MSKSGRYASQRRKVENLTAAKTITVADCGTTFLVGSADLTHTLPTVANAGQGWWCRFVVNDETQRTRISNDASDGDNMVGAFLGFTDNAVTQMSPVAGTAYDLITFTTSCVQGDWVEIYTDGTLWYCHGFGAVADVITGS